MSEIKKYQHIRLEPADNGFVLEYTEVKEAESKGTYSDSNYYDRQVVFPDGEEGIDGALAKMKEMYMFNKTKKSGVLMTPLIASNSDSDMD